MSAQERTRTGLQAHVVHERHPLRHEWKQHSGDTREGRWRHTEAIGAKPASRSCHAAAATAATLVEATPCACESPCTARQGGGSKRDRRGMRTALDGMQGSASSIWESAHPFDDDAEEEEPEGNSNHAAEAVTSRDGTSGA